MAGSTGAPFAGRLLLEPTASPLPRASRLLPDVVVRITGLPTRYLEELRDAGLLAAHRRWSEASAASRHRAAELAERLYPLVGAAESPRLRRRLLQLRRDLHNFRRVPERRVRELRPDLPTAFATELETWLESQQALLQGRDELLTRHTSALETARRRFRAFVADADFRSGLLLSSTPLSRALDRMLTTAPRSESSKQRQLERGLLRYFSRMVMKTSPYSTFCAVMPGAPVPGEEIVLRGDPRRKTRAIRLNKAIYGQLVQSLLRRPAVRRSLEVELHSALVREGDTWTFFSNHEGRETVHRLGASPVIELFRQLLAEAGALPLGRLLDRVCNHPRVQTEPAAAERFADRLLELGFLRFRLGISDQEAAWDRPLIERLRGIEDPAAAATVGGLEALGEKRRAFATAPIDRRGEILSAARKDLATTFEALKIETTPGDGFLPFYEDSAAGATLELPAATLDELTQQIAEVTELTRRLAWPRSEQATMRHFFDHCCRDAGPSIPLLTFHETFYRDFFKAHLERLQGPPPAAARDLSDEEASGGEEEPIDDLANPFGLPEIEQCRQALGRLHERIARRWGEDPSREEITLSREDLRHDLGLAAPGSPHPRSLTCFVQLLPGDPARLVWNTSFAGYGKYFSRFLYLLPDAVLERLQRANRELDAGRLAEIRGDAGFNANLHPPLLPFEIEDPTLESEGGSHRLSVTNLRVEADPDDPHALCLRLGPGGVRVQPVDLGFLNPRMRPPLYQLLSRFAPACNFTFPMPALPAPVPETYPRVLHRPRLSYRGRLVLSRRAWVVPAAAFPRPVAGESEAELFSRVQDWRLEHGIPDEVFLSLQVLPGEGTSRQPLRRHLYKPQLIDFANPLLVDLFVRAPVNLVNFTATLSERLPARRHLPRHAEGRFVTELILQIDQAGKPAGKTGGGRDGDARPS